MRLARHAALMVRDLGSYVVRSGTWWFPVVVVILGITALVLLTAKVVVPTAVYVLF